MSIKTRFQLKSDTEANWSRAVNFRPLKGEVIIYTADDSHPFSRLKVGDGATAVVDLPFIDANTITGKEIQIHTTEEWNQLPNYIPNYGDIIIYSDKNSSAYPGIKIGDGSTYCIDLPFIGDENIITLQQHINNTVVHITNEERNFWNNKLNYDNQIIEENLIFTRY